MIKNKDVNYQEIDQLNICMKLALMIFTVIVSLQYIYINFQSQFVRVGAILWGIAIGIYYIRGVLDICYSNKKYRYSDNYKRNLDYILQYIFCIIATMVCGEDNSQVKILFITTIIISALEDNNPIRAAIIASVCITVMDITFILHGGCWTRLQGDIIVIMLFFVIAYLLKQYISLQYKYVTNLKNSFLYDELTGVYKHTYLQDKIKEKLKSTNKERIYLVLIDIDDFKLYNQDKGFAKGDSVLRMLPLLIQEYVEQENIARFEGDCFAIIIENKYKKEVWEICNKICKIVEHTYVEGQKQLPGETLTVSLGISDEFSNVESQNELIQSAKYALDEAKRCGKNSVRGYISIAEEIKAMLNAEETEAMQQLMNTLKKKHPDIFEHSRRLVQYSRVMVSVLNLNEHQSKILVMSAYMHDLGMIHIDDKVLTKEECLTDKEWDTIKDHPHMTLTLLSQIKGVPQECLYTIKYHHERYNGTGYPDKLKGEGIPYLSRVLCIMDSFDAMLSEKNYRRRLNYEEAIEELRHWSGVQFDPKIAEQFIRGFEDNK